MSNREEWPKAKEASRQLAQRVDIVVQSELPAAVKRSGYWFIGSVAGDAGDSMFIGARGDRAGRWKDGAHDTDRGDLIDLIAAVRGVSLSDAYEITCTEYLGYQAHGAQPSTPKRRAAPPSPVQLSADGSDARARERVAQIWRAAVPTDSTPAETYLRGRGITCALPRSLRFHAKCPRRESDDTPTEFLPAMVAAIVDIQTGQGLGVHRTFIQADGRGKIAHGKDKMILGASVGGCVKLTPDDAVTTSVGITEGIETGLSVLQLGYPVWSVINAGGIRSFPVLRGVECLNIFADHDAISERTGKRAGLDAAEACARRWLEAAREVRIIYPSAEGADWNDVARAA